jgi:hypothetical protein
MKTLKSMLTGVALLFICVAASATVKQSADKPTKNDVVNAYIDAIAHGKTDNLGNILDDGLQFNIVRGDHVNTLNKDQLLDYMKNNTVADAPVSTSTTIVQQDDDAYVVKVDFKYGDFTRTDTVTIENNGGWAVTKVQSTFK